MIRSLTSRQERIVNKFKEMGIIIEKIETTDKLKESSWVMPTKDKKGIIQLNLKKMTS